MSYGFDPILELKAFSVTGMSFLGHHAVDQVWYDPQILDSDAWFTKEIRMMGNPALSSNQALLNLLWCTLGVSEEQDDRSK